MKSIVCHGLFLYLIAVASLSGRVASAERNATPNIIVILADDLGYGDLSCYGATEIQTPAIDRLAREGVRFTNGYCSASTCTPTRFSLLTGTYAFRQKRTGIAPPNAPAIIKPGTETLPSILQRAGYATAVVGKWHLGLGDPAPDWNGTLSPGPLEIGFDRCFLLPTTNDRVPQVFVEDRHVKNLDPKDPLWVGDQKPSEDHPTGISDRSSLRMDWTHGHNQTIHNGIGRIGFYTGGVQARFRDEDLADHWIAESNRWIESHRDRPFFLYFASHDLHVPRMPHERFQGASKLGPRGDSILQLDWCVSELMKTLDRLQIADNTLIVFCSDNGPVLDDGYRDDAVEKLGTHRPHGPLRGGKYSVWEGGTRTPMITHWPGVIRPGVSEEMVCTVDFATSFASLVKQTIPANAFLDSFDLSEVLLGKPEARGRDHLLQQDNGSGNFGLRSGDWKLVRLEKRAKTQAIVTLGDPPLPEHRDTIYNLATDPGERVDLAESHPEILHRLQTQLEEIVAAGRTRPLPSPNVVFIVADDMGYADMGTQGAVGFQTPHLDQLAAQGTRFTDFYVAQAVCTASRTALLTGCYPNRLGMQGAYNHTSMQGIADEEWLLSEMFHDRGYATAGFGKWHLGTRMKFHPRRHGFDEWFGIPYSNDNSKYHPTLADEMPPLPLYDGEDIIEHDPDQSLFTKRITERSVDFINRHSDRPFFLYVPHIMPHVPIFASKEFQGKSGAGLYGDVMQEIDWSVGQILDALQRAGIEENTLVVFISDNGPFLSYGEHAGSAAPLREGKLTTFDGGVRVPCLVRWPGKVPAGRVCNTPFMGIDWLPTLTEIVGGQLPSLPIDGRSVTKLLFSTQDTPSPHEVLYFYSGTALQALRSGRWKLHFPHPYITPAGEPGRLGKPSNFGKLAPASIQLSGVEGIATRHGYRIEQLELALFDLESDPGESENVADKYPEIVQRLSHIADRAREDLGDSLTNTVGSGLRSPATDTP